jgi:hypothetical protein
MQTIIASVYSLPGDISGHNLQKINFIIIKFLFIYSDASIAAEKFVQGLD